MRRSAVFPILLFACQISGNAELARYAGEGYHPQNNYLIHYHKARSNKESAVQEFLMAARQQPRAIACQSFGCAGQTLATIPPSERSPLFSYAAYHLAELAEKEALHREALDILALAENSPQVLARKISLLRGKILTALAPKETATIAHWQKHAEQFGDPESLYFTADAFYRAGQISEAQKIAFKVLESPEADFPFAQSGVLLRQMLGQRIYQLEPLELRIRLMEALRVAKDMASAQRLFQTLAQRAIPENHRLLFSHYAVRLLSDLRQFSGLEQIAMPAQQEILQNEKVALDICERLLKKQQFGLLEKIFPLQPASKAGYQCLLRLALRNGDFGLQSRTLAAHYIRQFDAESVLAERVFLRTCLPQKKSEQPWDIACLEELRHLTQGLKIGAGARYFLARHYDTKDPEKTRVLLAEIAENYADDYYYFRLLENPLNTQRAWAKNFKSDGTRGAELLNALLQGDLAAAGNLRIPDELIKLEKEIQGLAKNLSGEQRLALLLLAADSRDEMRELLRKEERPQIYKILAALGHVAQKPDIALYGVKMYLREKKFAPFVAELPPLLRDMLYPRPFTELVMRYSARAGFEPAEVFALIRQESQFFPQAVSVANARGLMQLLPATARQLARQEKLTQFDLFDPQDNIRLGTAFLRQLRQNYAADFLAIAIAYNAGPGRLLEWRKKLNPDTDIFIEEIPFWETYHYVRILLADRARYRVLLSRK